MNEMKQKLTLRQIAKLAGTSKSTVSRVLTSHPSVSPKTRARIDAVIKKHKFKPNLFARGLAGGRTGLIAVLTSEINSGFYAEVIKGIDQVASQHQGHLLSSFAHGIDDYIDLWQSFAEGGRVDGMILIAPPMEMLNCKLRPGMIPVTLCSCRTQDMKKGWDQVDSVTVDNETAMIEVLKHLQEQGCSRFAYVAGPDNVYDALERRRVFEKFITEHPNLTGTLIPAHMTRESGRVAILRYLQQSPLSVDAFVAVNDLAALGTLEALKELGLAVPKNVAVTGFDDDDASGILGLTTIHMPMLDLGRETARLLFERLARQREALPVQRSTVGMTLKVRTTSLRSQPPA